MEMTTEQRDAVRKQFEDALLSTLDDCVEEGASTAEAFSRSMERLAEIGAEHDIRGTRVCIYVGHAFGRYSSGNGRKFTEEIAAEIRKNMRMVGTGAVICPVKPPSAYITQE